jgi:hypothetical protein
MPASVVGPFSRSAARTSVTASGEVIHHGNAYGVGEILRLVLPNRGAGNGSVPMKILPQPRFFG